MKLLRVGKKGKEKPGIFEKNKKLAVKTTQINESGRKIFHPNLISWSNRYLGTIALTKENKINRTNILNIIHKGPGIIVNG